MPAVARATTSSGRSPLIVHSHLRWDFVWQRPQQILSRFARHRAVLFVEEPVFADDCGAASVDVTRPSAGIHRVVPRLPRRLAGSYDDSAETIRSLVLDLIGEGGALAGAFDHAVQWFYTPMPAPIMIGAFGERGVVYDCMDELAQFRFAPPDLVQRERYLLASADVVFTGGRQLYESKSRHHRNVHFFGCGVDADHFARARSAETPLARELAELPRPILGYFGVVDERLDYALIDRLAASFEAGSVVFVGPLAKVDPGELPNRPNVHWLGQREYARLPEYVKGFDVCLMPFALNEATEFINPTKTLEYMAAGKPIVSTAVRDVVLNFTPIVRVAFSPDAFVEGVEAALAPDAERIEAGIARARDATWESIITAMDRLIGRAVANATAQQLGSAAEAMVWRRRATGGRPVTSRPDATSGGAASVA